MSRVIFKLTFKHPNLKDTKNKNIAHVRYIATRSGVDKSVTERDLEKELSKELDINDKDKITDENSLLEDGKTVTENDLDIELSHGDNLQYLKYIKERPRSHGLFGADGVADIDETIEEINACQSYVWRGIVSLREEDAIKLGFLEKEMWQDLLRKKMPDIAAEMGIRVTNLRWAAAIHMEHGHPHAHIMFWETAPERALGAVSKKCLENIRKTLTDEIFENERFQLMNEKDAMRDLIRDLAKDDVGQAAQLIKEVRSTGTELRALVKEMNIPGVAPKIYSEDEIELAEKIKKLAEMLPGKGRIMLKFMPDDVKEEVRTIAEHLLSQPEFSASLAKNLKSIEDMTRMYTGKDEDVQRARENAYKDIRDRICQIILRGTAESQKDNLLFVDDELASNYISVISNMNNKINLLPEQVSVLNQMAVGLIRTGHDDGFINSILKDFSIKNNLVISENDVRGLISELKKSGVADMELNVFSSSKKIDFMLSALKLAGYSEDSAFNILSNSIKEDSKKLEKELGSLKDNGYLSYENGGYTLTKYGIEELLKEKSLDAPQKAIMDFLSEGDKHYIQLIENKGIFGSLYDKDPDEFKISKYDLRVREEFGESNKITMSELQANVYGRYYVIDPDQLDKADNEFDILKNRIEKLCLNGYVKFDKETNLYSFTPEGLQELSEVTDKIEFTKYDANVTLSYIDKAEDKILRADELKDILEKDIVNTKASSYYENFTELLKNNNSKPYINVDHEGNISATELGKSISYELQKIIKFFNEADGKLTQNSLMENKEFKGVDGAAKYKNVIQCIRDQESKGNVYQLSDGSYILDPLKQNVKNLAYQLYKEGGTINLKELKSVLERNIPNQEAENQYRYLIKRLDNLKKEGYVTGNDKEYSLTDRGIEKRNDLLTPEREYLRKEIRYLCKLGFIEPSEGGYRVTKKYINFKEQVSKNRKSGVVRKSRVFKPEIIKLIDKTYNLLNTSKIERTNQRIATGKYINNNYLKLPSDYGSLRAFCHVEDTFSRTIHKITTGLLVSGVSINDTKTIIQQWNIRSNSNIPQDKLNEAIDKSHSIVKDDQQLGKIMVISKKEWDQLFNDLGIKEPPKWIYKGYNWKDFNQSPLGLASIVNDIWKSAWREFEKSRMQNEAQAEMTKKALIRQQASHQNISARREEARKNADKGSMYYESDFIQ